MIVESFELPAVKSSAGLKPENLDEFRRLSQGLPDGRYTIRVERFRHRRTNAQNRFWWGTVVKLFAEHCGEYDDDMHEILKVQLLPKEVETVDPETGEVTTVKIGRSTTRLSTSEFKDLIARAQHLGATMGIYIPDPGEMAA